VTAPDDGSQAPSPVTGTSTFPRRARQATHTGGPTRIGGGRAPHGQRPVRSLPFRLFRLFRQCLAPDAVTARTPLRRPEWAGFVALARRVARVANSQGDTFSPVSRFGRGGASMSFVKPCVGFGLVEGAVAEHRVEHADAVSGEAEQGLRMGLPAGSAEARIGAGRASVVPTIGE